MPKPDEIDFLNPNQKRVLTPEQQQAEDPTFQRNHPEMAAANRYGFNPDSFSPGNALGKWARPWLAAAGNKINPMFDHGAALGTAAGGAMGFGTGWLADKLTNALFGGDLGLSWKLGLLGAGAGGLTGYHRKNASATDQLAVLIKQDPTLTNYERAIVLQYIQHQPAAERQKLLRVAMQVGGAGIGAIIAKQLLGSNLMSLMLGGFAGSQAGEYFANDRNSAGQQIRAANL